MIALALGLGAAALLRPGDGMQLTETVAGPVGEVPSVASILLGMIPTNVFRAFSDGNVVQIVVLALLVGVATIALRDGPAPASRPHTTTSPPSSGAWCT